LWNAKPLSGDQSRSRDVSHAMPSSMRPCISITCVAACTAQPSRRSIASAARAVSSASSYWFISSRPNAYMPSTYE
jgi:hypothetical protein